MHRAASAVVTWVPRLMDRHDTTKMDIDDTGLVWDWIPRHVNTTDQGQLGEMATIIEQKQAEGTTRHDQEEGEVEGSKQMEEGAGTNEQVAADTNKVHGKKTQASEPQEKKRPPKKVVGV